jgi:hypothetical protein
MKFRNVWEMVVVWLGMVIEIGDGLDKVQWRFILGSCGFGRFGL